MTIQQPVNERAVPQPASQGAAAQRSASARTTTAPRRRGSLRRWARPLRIVGTLVVLFAAWAIVSPNFPSFVFPTPLDVGEAFVSAVSRGAWGQQVLATLGHLLTAFGIVVVVGLPLGIFIGRSRVAEDISRVPLIFLQTIPTIVLIALALIILGISDASVIGVTVAGSMTYFLLNVIQGTRAIDQDLVDMARAYRARESVIMRSVVFPSVVPYFLAGARITIGVAWQITMFSEYMMGSSGVGFQVSTAIKLLDMPAVFMWGLSVVLLTIVVEYGIFRPAEAFLTRHQRGRS